MLHARRIDERSICQLLRMYGAGETDRSGSLGACRDFSFHSHSHGRHAYNYLKTIPAVSFMLGAILVFCAWFVYQFTKIEYEYTVASAVLTLDKIYGARTRKKVLEFKISDITAAFTPEKLDVSIKNAEHVLWACRKDDPYALGLVYTVGSEKRILIICAPDKTRACLKYYKRNIFSA